MTRTARAFVIVLVAATVAGCTTVGDGKVADDWPVFAEAKLPIPAAGTCSQVTVTDPATVTGTDFTKVGSCDESHESELVHVGTYEGPDADRADPPPAGGDAERRAFADCTTKANEFLGDDWKIARVALRLASPPARHWQAGGRYYRCELISVGSETWDIVARTGSLKDGLRSSRPAAITCVNLVNPTPDGFDDMTAADCAQPHDAEFVGVFRAPEGAYPNEDQLDTIYEGGCIGLIATYLGISRSALLRLAFAYLYWFPTRETWTIGDRGGTCYVGGPDDKKLRASVKGWGARALPV